MSLDTNNEKTFIEEARALRLARAQAKYAELQREQASLERERKVKLVTDLTDFLRGNGSCGLVVLDRSSTPDVKGGLIASLGKENIFFLRAPGTVQNPRNKDSLAAGLLLNKLTDFKDRVGKNGLYVLDSFNFRGEDEGGMPNIRGFFEEAINKGKAPMTLAVGRGSVGDMPKSASCVSEVQPGLATRLAGRAVLFNNTVSIVDETWLNLEEIPRRGDPSATDSPSHQLEWPAMPDDDVRLLGRTRLP